MNIPDDLEYTDRHEWVRLEGEAASIGITDHLQSRLGPIISVEFPAVGRALRCGDPVAVLRSKTAAHVLNAPLSGVVLEANAAAANRPGLVNDDAYRAGWLVRMKVEAGEEVEHLRDASTYEKTLTASMAEVDSP